MRTRTSLLHVYYGRIVLPLLFFITLRPRSPLCVSVIVKCLAGKLILLLVYIYRAMVLIRIPLGYVEFPYDVIIMFIC